MPDIALVLDSTITCPNCGNMSERAYYDERGLPGACAPPWVHLLPLHGTVNSVDAVLVASSAAGALPVYAHGWAYSGGGMRVGLVVPWWGSEQALGAFRR